MTGVDVAVVGLFLIASLYLFTPSDADDRDVRESIEDDRERLEYEDDDREPYDQDADVWAETGGPC